MAGGLLNEVVLLTDFFLIQKKYKIWHNYLIMSMNEIKNTTPKNDH